MAMKDEDKSSCRVGFIGLGRMGYPMASHLAKAGFPLTVLDVRTEVVKDFCQSHDASPAESIGAVAEASDAVVIMLPTSREVRSVVLEDEAGGLAAHLTAGSLVIDCSSSDPSETKLLGEELNARSLQMVDAPVAGGVVFAKEGALDVLVGGEPPAVERARPVLKAFGKEIFECGGLGSAHAMKVLNNFVNAQALITYAEAMSVGLRFGIKPDIVVESLQAATTGRNHPFGKKIVKQVLSRDFASGMALDLIVKDVGLARDLAKKSGMEAPIASHCADLWRRASEEIGGSKDQTEVVRLWERMAGVCLKA